MKRTAQLHLAYTTGRTARMLGTDLKSANVALARRLGWRSREEFDDALLDECERGWHAEDELLTPYYGY
jgi:hypothetical protein